MEISSVEVWLIIGVVFIVIEFSTIPGIGFLFLALGSLTNSILLSSYPEIAQYQIATFGIGSLLWFLILWWPLKKFVYGKKKNTEQNYFDLVGNQVVVSDEYIEPGKIGLVSWSGTTMNAKLLESEKERAIAGETLYILKVRGNILICSRKIS